MGWVTERGKVLVEGILGNARAATAFDTGGEIDTS